MTYLAAVVIAVLLAGPAIWGLCFGVVQRNLKHWKDGK